MIMPQAVGGMSQLRDDCPRQLAVCHNYLPSIELIEAAENGLPRSFMMPRKASSAEISRSER
jgi:hypothetical protein